MLKKAKNKIYPLLSSTSHVILNQGIIDATETETRQYLFSYVYNGKKIRVVNPYFKWNNC